MLRNKKQLATLLKTQEGDEMSDNQLSKNEYDIITSFLAHAKNNDLDEVASRFTEESLKFAERGFYKLLIHSIVGKFTATQELYETGSIVEVGGAVYEISIINKGSARK